MAAREGIAIGTVKSRVARALAELRGVLGHG
jgi:DNA-directed RNA polymerase specialized sigma24 family protein